MQPEIVSGLFVVIGIIIGSLMSWLIQKEKLSNDMKITLESAKTENMAVETVLYYLNHKGYTDRSFVILQKRIGGFDDDELRKILVRAGAVRFFREDGSEWWRLLSRFPESSEKRKFQDLGKGNDDL